MAIPGWVCPICGTHNSNDTIDCRKCNDGSEHGRLIYTPEDWSSQ